MIIRYIDALLILLPILTGIVNYKYLSIDLKIVLYLLVIVGIFNLMLFVTHYQGINNTFLLKVFNQLEFIFFASFYITILRQFFNIKVVATFSSLVYVFVFSSSFLLNNTSVFDSISRGIVGIFFIITSFTFIYQVNFTEKAHTYTKATILLNYGILFYFLSTFLIFFFGDILLSKYENAFVYIWHFNSIASIITTITFTIALWKVRAQLI